MATRVNPLVNSGFTVSISALPGIRFTKASGLSNRTPEIAFYDGFSREPRVIRQDPERATVTLEVPYDPSYVAPVLTWFNTRTPSVLNVQPFRYDGGKKIELPQTLAAYDVLPTGYELPNTDASGKDIAYITLTVSCQGVKPTS